MQSLNITPDRNEILLHLQKNLPFIEPSVLCKTEKKCFEVAKTQEKYLELIQDAINLYKYQAIFYNKIYYEIQSEQTNILENKLNTSISSGAKSENECNSSENQTDFNSLSINTKLYEKEPVNSSEYTEFVRELIQRLKLAINDTEKAEILKKIKFFYPQVYMRLLELKAQLDKEKKRNISKDEDESAAKKFKTKLDENADEPNCAVCLDSFNEIKNKNNKILSTTCGHIICSECSNKYYMKAKKSHNISCFKCRKTLKFKDIHPIFI